MTTIMLMRHGDTAWNVERIFRGRVDVELSEIGIKQATLLARYLSGSPIEAIYSSPLKRALKTAEIVAVPHHMSVTLSEQLIDFDYGDWQGLPEDAVKERYRTLYTEWLKNPHLARIPGGESLDDVSRRALCLLNWVVPRHQGVVILVSHRVVHKVLVCALLGLDSSHFWNIRLDTCGLTTFAHEEGRFILTSHNDTSFLRPIGRSSGSDF